jgi:hypothetical protein
MKIFKLVFGLLFLGVICRAQDVITLNDGEEIRVEQDERTFSVGEVASIAFGGDGFATMPSKKTLAPPPPAKVKISTTSTAMRGSTAATYDLGGEIRLSITEFNARKADMVGKIVKLPLLYRGNIQSIGEGEYEATVGDENSSMDIRFGQDAFPYVESIKTLDYRGKNQGLAKRGYYLFGKVEVHRDSFGGVRFRPIGRTKKGDSYVW